MDLDSVISGAIDIHVHAGPSFFDRKADVIDLATLYQKNDFGGFVLKSHFGNTFPLTQITQSRVSDIDIFSSITLNSFVGGFNPVAVEHAVATEAVIVWLPTFSAANFSSSTVGRSYPFSNQSLTATNPEGEVKQATIDVLETIHGAERNIVLGNGHLSRSETFAILSTIEDLGLDITYLITHPDFSFMGLSLADQVALADRGCLIEKCYLPLVSGDSTTEMFVESIQEIGPENCLLSTDHGQSSNPSPPDAYRTFIGDLLSAGLTDGEIEQMAVRTPQAILDVE